MSYSDAAQSGGASSATPESTLPIISHSPRPESLFTQPISSHQSARTRSSESTLHQKSIGSAERRSLISTHTDKKAVYICSCKNSDRVNDCCCSNCYIKLKAGNGPCIYSGRCVEPLAWTIENDPVPEQSNCLLFTVLPKELRDLVYEYVLTDSADHWSTDYNGTGIKGVYHDTNTYSRATHIAISLLLTCRAIYLETYTLPLSLNPVAFSSTRSQYELAQKLIKFLPWQFATIQSLDISVQQIALEGSGLWECLFSRTTWKPQERHSGVYVAPQLYKFETHRQGRFPGSFGFTLLPADKAIDRKRLSDVRDFSHDIFQLSKFPLASTARVKLAKPLVYLTLRLSRTDWWTWTDDPNSTNDDQQLGLDPAVGDGSALTPKRPNTARMQQLADERRTGRFPSTENQDSGHSNQGHESQQLGWATTIAKLPDLKRLTLVLETFAEKKHQLETVVECAKTWKFPIEGTQFELVWDGKVEESSWSSTTHEAPSIHEPPAPPLYPGTRRRTGSIFPRTMRHFGRRIHQLGPEWYEKSTEFEVRTVSFTRRRAL